MVTLDLDCTDDVNIELRIFEYDSDEEEYQFIGVDKTRCGDNDEEDQVFARGSDNQFLVIATKKSSTGDYTDFRLEMETECDSRRRQIDGRGQSGGAKGRKLQVRKTLECGDEEKDKVTDGRRNPPRGVFNDESCQTDVKNKNNQVVDEDWLADTYYLAEGTDDDTSIQI